MVWIWLRSPANDAGSYNVRIEPELDDSWPKRIDRNNLAPEDERAL